VTSSMRRICPQISTTSLIVFDEIYKLQPHFSFLPFSSELSPQHPVTKHLHPKFFS
jgi:hypothetical protein